MSDNNFVEHYWYTLRSLVNEDKLSSLISDYVSHHKLGDRILEIKFFQEFRVVEGEEISSDSDLLPKRGFKSSPTSVWVKLSNGNYKRLKVVERRPFKGMIFIKMEHDHELFRLARVWDPNSQFMGYPNPIPITDVQMKKTEESIDKSIPDIQEYAREKGYTIVEGSVLAAKKIFVDSHEKEQELEDVSDLQVSVDSHENEKILSEQEVLEAKKAEIYSDLKIKEYEDTIAPSKGKSKSKKGEKFKVNDFVFIKKLGFKGVIQEINFEEGTLVVGVQMFGRRQPIACKISEVSEI
ncbi:transcription antitermination protein NusG [Mycoplasma haemocanis str. Illinois]|uniref:Transcription termination/antitermination protein NusG n=1 Tax=Mycoplasma haemocanis (strain Illinois) TaxID=1111676 RepID=H6N5V8_MYCHN|nr:transcription termination/antitermination protein NusG [Mycoplasma haemocanis]AEW44873.1 transcription antitermination protein NusG [Mycoplasma haemocanis str. Illinois]